MSLDVYLTLPGASTTGSGIFVRESGTIREISREEWDAKFPSIEPVIVNRENEPAAYDANITHNLAEMADKAGIYKALWRPEELEITRAYQLIEPLKAGLTALREKPDYFKQFNPDNGWGDYDGLVSFTERYLAACERYPQAEVSVWR